MGLISATFSPDSQCPYDVSARHAIDKIDIFHERDTHNHRSTFPTIYLTDAQKRLLSGNEEYYILCAPVGFHPSASQ
jgi:hypothetical protein